MGARKLSEQHIRNITQNSSGTYSVTIPLQMFRELSWQKGQKVTIKRQGKKLILEDWQA